MITPSSEAGDDILPHFGVRDVDHLHAFLMDRLSPRREVVSFRSPVIFQHVRNPVLESLG